jgi:hypothetical protein
MRADEVKALLAPNLVINPILARLTGSVSAAVMLSQAIYWSNHISDTGGWFHTTRVDFEKETTLSCDKQSTARARLGALGFMHAERRGAPPMLFYRVDFDAIAEAVTRYVENCVRENDMPQRVTLGRATD